MKKKITLVVFRNSASKVNQFSFQQRSFIIAGAVFLIGFCGFVGLMADYFQLRQDSTQNRVLVNRIASQQQEIATQRLQITKFANEINGLKDKLVGLNQFEKKIRIIANIEKKGDSGGVFGIGGSIPADLDIDTSLQEKQDHLIRNMHGQVNELTGVAQVQKQGLASVLQKMIEKRNLLAATPSIMPVDGYITSGFGYRKSPFTGRREMHKGLDIAACKGSSIIATADGIITFSGNRGLLGKAVIIDHGHGITTRYAHCYKLLRKRGDLVKRGDLIARVGNTGRSTGPHLHYEVKVHNIQVNPGKYILNLRAAGRKQTNRS